MIISGLPISSVCGEAASRLGAGQVVGSVTLVAESFEQHDPRSKPVSSLFLSLGGKEMCTRSPLWLAALLLSSAALWASSLYAQQPAELERQAIVNRQRVRAMLAAALADGVLSRKEQYAILLEARDLLSPPELRGLQRTLDEAAAKRETPEKVADLRSAATEDVSATLTGFIVPASQEEAAESDKTTGDGPPRPEDPEPSAEEPAKGRDVVHSHESGSPFKTEGSEPEPIDPGYLVKELTKDVAPETEIVEGDIEFETATIFADPDEWFYNGWRRLKFYSTIDAFKGPVDLDNQNGNFGIRFAFNGGFPLHPPSGFGLQVGTSEVLSDFHGTRFTGATIRSQNFTTVGLFQRHPMAAPNLSWGFAFDWVHDRYFSTLQMSQWRIKLAYDWDCWREFGLWATIPDSGDYARVGSDGAGYSIEHFKPIAQGNFYYRRYWENGGRTSCWLGVAEKPTEVILGGDAEIPLTERIALTGEMTYFLPTASGIAGQEEEMWNVSVGLVFTPGRLGNHGRPGQFDAFLPLANNGTFGVRRF